MDILHCIWYNKGTINHLLLHLWRTENTSQQLGKFSVRISQPLPAGWSVRSGMQSRWRGTGEMWTRWTATSGTPSTTWEESRQIRSSSQWSLIKCGLINGSELGENFLIYVTFDRAAKKFIAVELWNGGFHGDKLIVDRAINLRNLLGVEPNGFRRFFWGGKNKILSFQQAKTMLQ